MGENITLQPEEWIEMRDKEGVLKIGEKELRALVFERVSFNSST